MQIKLSAPKRIETSIQLPSSKSISNRVLIMHALGKGKDKPQNLSDCDDTQVMVRALADIHQPVVDIMAAGTAMRFLTAYLSVSPGERIITGTQRMKQRPIQILVEALRSLGAQIEYTEKEGFPPLKITGTTLHKEAISLPGNVSSQYISALLMIAPTLPQGLRLTLTGKIISRPYIDLTIALMKQFGVIAQWENEQVLKVAPQPYRSIPFFVESDWSAASYWYQLAALCPEANIDLPYLFKDSLQGDSKVADLFQLLGVSTTFTPQGVHLQKEKRAISRFDYNFINQPDLAQTLVVTCALLHLPFRFEGLQSLKIKETDRMAALICEMRKLGYVLHEEEGSILYWDGERCTAEENPVIETYEDHRMAMAFAPAGMVIQGLRINHPEVVSKSYPHFWENLQQAGFSIEKED